MVKAACQVNNVEAKGAKKMRNVDLSFPGEKNKRKKPANDKEISSIHTRGHGNRLRRSKCILLIWRCSNILIDVVIVWIFCWARSFLAHQEANFEHLQRETFLEFFHSLLCRP